MRDSCLSDNMKKVLIVTYYFPPSGGSGVQRMLKFVKYLREFGWEPVVLTARNADYPAYDESLMEEIPNGVKVYRSRIVEPYKLYRRLTGRSPGESADIATLTLSEGQKKKFSERLSEWIRSTLFVPDARMLWRLFAVRMGRRIIRHENIEVILSSAPPYTTHLIGAALAKWSGLPWIADFRDSWIGWLSTPQWRPAPVRRVEMKMEERVLKNATTILTVSNGVKEDLLSRHPYLRDERWKLLPNGYDHSDFEGIRPVPKDRRLVITYTGSMYGNRNPEYLVQALEQLREEMPDLSEKLLIRIVGRVGDAILERIESSAAGDLFDVISYVSHAESLAYLLASDIALLIIDDAPANRGILTGKLFEYIGAQKPILALAPEGDAAELIRREGFGMVVPPRDVVAIKSYLLQALKDKPALTAANEHAEKFRRREQTRQLAELMGQMVAEKQVQKSLQL